ncbi:MAG: DUF5906 domain-containing protein [Spirosomataceae bacterium]
MKNQSKNQTQNTENEGKVKNFQELKNFIRVGDDYFKRVMQPDKSGKQYPVYLKRTKGTIIDDYGKSSLEYIKKYEGFVCVPSHINFQEEINGFFNEYAKLSYSPKEGEFKHILILIRHIFGENHVEFALDYLQLLYTKPTQRLPILLLESKERGTGKSTFGNLVSAMFEDNAVKLGNSDFESDFNAIWIKRLAIIVDETSLDKRGIMQMIKRLSTETGKTTSNEKNKSQVQIDFIGKFFFMSNDEGKALPIEKGETRFAVFKVPTFQEKGIEEIMDMEVRIQSEIPAFVHYLNNRKLYHSEQSRMYFGFDVYQTEQLKLYFENSISPLAKAVKNLVRDTFLHFPEVNELKFALRHFQQQLKDSVRGIERERLRKVIEEELGIKQSEKQRFTYYDLLKSELNPDFTPQSNGENTRPYTFRRQDFSILE